ncbi:kinesin-like protein subito [Drosophila miranda]|uniref:kinesin-like protein subito n=1 Tax=Drosophila miranda TaxID=7229 RepID=UPI00143F346C|nr:kinesin-like protein subito [Drosophila miranda]
MSDSYEAPVREKRSFLMARDPSIDRRCRPRPEKKLRLFDDIHDAMESTDGSDSESECASNGGDYATSVPSAEDISVGDTGPQVFLRLRPVGVASKAYSVSDDGKVLVTSVKSENTSTNVNKMVKHFGFTSIFDGSVGQRDVYDICVGPRILEEECVTIMTYGTSGSGKTYTLLGDDVLAGVIPRGLEHIFTIYMENLYHSPKLKLVNGCIEFLQDETTLREMQISKKLLSLCPDIGGHHERLKEAIQGDHTFETKDDPNVSVMIWVSFVEIYNELVYDLLTIPPRQENLGAVPRKPMKISCNKGQVYIKGLTTVFVRSSEEALQLLRLGQQRSTYASTSVNANSSRSHCVFIVDVLKYNCSGMTTQCSYKFCDLAGSERVNNTVTIGLRLKEATNINTSLMTLGRCLDAASTSRKKPNNDVIPFRDSKLTMLLQAALLGKERLAMIVTVTPLEKFYEENLNVLNFASIAKNIIFKEPLIKQHSTRYSGFFDNSKKNTQYEYIKEIEENNISLRQEIDRLKLDHVLKKQLLEERLQKEISETYQELLRGNKKQWEKQAEKQRLMAEREFEFKLAAQKRLYEEQIEDLKDEIEELKPPSSESDSIDEKEDEPNASIEILDDE